MSKGQAISADVVLGMFVFGIMFAFAYANFSGSMQSLDTKNDFETMRLSAIAGADLLVSSSGSPSNWETILPADTNRLGLVQSDRNISIGKLSAFSSYDYNLAKEKTGLGGYDFFFLLDGADDVNVGIYPPSGISKVAEKRIVNYKGGAAIVTLTVYRR